MSRWIISAARPRAARRKVRTHSSEPEDDGGGDGDGGHEGMGASVVTGVAEPPILEPVEHILDLVPLAIEFAVPVGLRRDARRDAAHGERLAEPVNVVALSRATA
jgi:hypothetical protein